RVADAAPPAVRPCDGDEPVLRGDGCRCVCRLWNSRAQASVIGVEAGLGTQHLGSTDSEYCDLCAVAGVARLARVDAGSPDRVRAARTRRSRSPDRDRVDVRGAMGDALVQRAGVGRARLVAPQCPYVA